MKLKQLIKLADAADGRAGIAFGKDLAQFYAAANPATVKRMAELLVQCREAMMDFDYDKRIAALAALDEFEGSEATNKEQ